MNFKARMKSLLIVITLCWSANAMSNTAANVCGDLTFDRYSLDQAISYHGRQSGVDPTVVSPGAIWPKPN